MYRNKYGAETSTIARKMTFLLFNQTLALTAKDVNKKN